MPPPPTASLIKLPKTVQRIHELPCPVPAHLFLGNCSSGEAGRMIPGLAGARAGFVTVFLQCPLRRWSAFYRDLQGQTRPVLPPIRRIHGDLSTI